MSSDTDEVASYVDESQFEPGESAYECGFFAVALNAAAGKPGAEPAQSGEWVDQQADKWYLEVTGLANTPANKRGMSLLELFYTIHVLAGLHYQNFKVDLEWIRGYINHGYPVILSVIEDSVFDIALGDRVPYGWKPLGNHLITATAVAANGNLLFRDPASVTIDGVRPGPREYDVSRLKINSATAIVLPWLARPVAGFDPTTAPVSNTLHTHVIQPGETLAHIASMYGIATGTLLAENQKVLDDTAREYGHLDSQSGNVIFPGTILHW